MSKQEIDKWRRCDQDFDFFYSRVPYGERATFICLYKTIFDNWYGTGIPYNTSRKQQLTITSKIPSKIRKRYSLKPGDKFIGASMLNSHCKTIICAWYWKRKGWIVSDIE